MSIMIVKFAYLGLWQIRNIVTVQRRMVVLDRLVLCSCNTTMKTN